MNKRQLTFVLLVATIIYILTMVCLFAVIDGREYNPNPPIDYPVPDIPPSPADPDPTWTAIQTAYPGVNINEQRYQSTH